MDANQRMLAATRCNPALKPADRGSLFVKLLSVLDTHCHTPSFSYVLYYTANVDVDVPSTLIHQKLNTTIFMEQENTVRFNAC